MLPLNPNIPAPDFLETGLPSGDCRPVSAWCAEAGIPYRVSGGRDPLVYLSTELPRHAWTMQAGQRIYGVAAGMLPETRDVREQALRVLEVLAHGFHDYGARESVCHRGLFGVTKSTTPP